MYVLEGVTPCIQSMMLQAGDTVTFSRVDPGGKLIMGSRKAANAGDMQGCGLTNGTSTEDTSSSGVTENPPSINGSSCISLIPKELNGMPENLNSETNGGRIGDDPTRVKEKKRTRTIGAKNKRLLLHSEESMELRLTWEEAQDLLRPSPSVKPTIVVIEEQEIEEYDEPPVFGKRTIVTTKPSGEQERWATCDDCSKWRRLPVDALLSFKWTCIDNVWDVSRCSCSAPEESLKELENVLKVGRGMKSFISWPLMVLSHYLDCFQVVVTSEQFMVWRSYKTFRICICYLCMLRLPYVRILSKYGLFAWYPANLFLNAAYFS
jgi:hypothetical protein